MEQARFAALLSRRGVHEDIAADGTAENLWGPLVSGWGFTQDIPLPIAPSACRGIFLREKVNGRRRRRPVVSQRRRPNAMIAYSLQFPSIRCSRRGKVVGWSGGCSGKRRHTNLAGWEASLEPGSFPILENRLRLQDILPLNMRATIPKRSLGRHVESRTASLPGGGREGEAIRAHPVTLPFLGRSSKC